MKVLLLNIGIYFYMLASTTACWPNFKIPFNKYPSGPSGSSKPTQYASVDCNETGIFTKAPPFNRRYWKLPQCPDVIRPTFTLHTRSNILNGVIINYNPWSTIPSVFNSSARTVFIAHGFHDSTTTGWIGEFITELLEVENLNVITVDWRRGADVGYLHYDLPASNTRTVGAQTALVMKHLVVTAGTTWGRLWCMGHSLGAHVCGHAGMEARKRGGVIGRVTGFDPAGVNFEKSPDLAVGVNPTSAAFVDIIHTTTILGTKRTLGHMDFYPSDGDFQDGCGVNGKCGHSRSEQYFRESIMTDCFLAREICTDFRNIPRSCTNVGRVVAIMGFRADVSGHHGIYRLDINKEAPFCRG